METRNKEIDIIALAEKVIKNWKQLLLCISIGAVIGVIVALNTPKTYKAEVMLAPELNSGGIGLNDNIADMASNFGIDLGSKSNMDAIYPELYPDVFASTDFVQFRRYVGREVCRDGARSVHGRQLRLECCCHDMAVCLSQVVTLFP